MTLHMVVVGKTQKGEREVAERVLRTGIGSPQSHFWFEPDLFLDHAQLYFRSASSFCPSADHWHVSYTRKDSIYTQASGTTHREMQNTKQKKLRQSKTASQKVLFKILIEI